MATLDRQQDGIAGEKPGPQHEIASHEGEAARATTIGAHLDAAATLLRELGSRLDQPLTWEVRRRLVEALEDGNRVETVGEGIDRDHRVIVTYRFALPGPSKVTIRTGSTQQPRSRL